RRIGQPVGRLSITPVKGNEHCIFANSCRDSYLEACDAAASHQSHIAAVHESVTLGSPRMKFGEWLGRHLHQLFDSARQRARLVMCEHSAGGEIKRILGVRLFNRGPMTYRMKARFAVRRPK